MIALPVAPAIMLHSGVSAELYAEAVTAGALVTGVSLAGSPTSSEAGAAGISSAGLTSSAGLASSVAASSSILVVSVASAPSAGFSSAFSSALSAALPLP